MNCSFFAGRQPAFLTVGSSQPCSPDLDASGIIMCMTEPGGTLRMRLVGVAAAIDLPAIS